MGGSNPTFIIKNYNRYCDRLKFLRGRPFSFLAMCISKGK